MPSSRAISISKPNSSPPLGAFHCTTDDKKIEKEDSLQAIVFMVMDTHRYEFLKLEFDSENALVKDVLEQLPMAVTENDLKLQEYIGICNLSGELEASHEERLSDFVLLNESKGGNRNRRIQNKVYLAIPRGSTGQDIAKIAAPVLRDPNALAMVCRAPHPGEQEYTGLNRDNEKCSSTQGKVLNASQRGKHERKMRSKKTRNSRCIFFSPITLGQERSLSITPADEKISLECLHAFSSLKVDNHKRHLKTYKRCFVGKDAVDLMVSLGHAKTRDDAVRIARIASEHYRLFHHVSGPHRFEDGPFLYTFEKVRNNKTNFGAS